jgi:hypothetical protein
MIQRALQEPTWQDSLAPEDLRRSLYWCLAK